MPPGDKLLGAFGVSLAMVTPGPKVSPVDTTGAGDIFGGSAVYRQQELEKSISELTSGDLHYSGAYVSTAASLSTEQNGGIPSIPERDMYLQLFK